MGRKTIDRTGEENINNFGSKMVITKYRNCHDVDVYFEEYNYVVESVYYSTFKNGEIKCPYEPRVYEHGCLGEGKYKSKENGKYTKCYTTWKNMLRRCYDSKFHEKHHTYNQCKASDEWLNYQNFGYWNSENYYEIEGQRTTLDKDILVKNNKIYSAETCIYVPEKINLLFTKRDSKRDKYPVGVCYEKRTKKFRVGCSLLNPETGKSEQTYLGDYNTPEQALIDYNEDLEHKFNENLDIMGIYDNRGFQIWTRGITGDSLDYAFDKFCSSSKCNGCKYHKTGTSCRFMWLLGNYKVEEK